MVCKTMVVTCCASLLLATLNPHMHCYMIQCYPIVTVATRQGSKKPAVLDQKKAYNICEWWTDKTPAVGLEPRSLPLCHYSCTMVLTQLVYLRPVLSCRYCAC